MMKILQVYQLQECLGNGSYGVVHLARNNETGQKVAIKMLKETFNSMEECMQQREVKALLRLKEHPNIIKLLDMRFENQRLYLIYEFVENNVYQMYSQEKLEEEQIKNIVLQCAHALQYIHSLGYFHRDLKPENILVENGMIKLIDFGLAREIKPPFTDYVATRWYRAPEIILHSTAYDQAVDIFALGCVTCELYLGRPLFVGASEIEQFDRMLQVLGTFNNQDWPEGVKLVNQLGVKLTHYPAKLLHIIKASPIALDLIQGMLKWNPKTRFTAKQISEHLLFKQQSTPEFAPRKLGEMGEQQQAILKKFIIPNTNQQKQQLQVKK